MRVASKSGSAYTADTFSAKSGESFVSNFNKWNNTAFAQHCLRQPSSELLMMAQREDLHTEKREIAARVLEQNFGKSPSGNVV
ncbi:hypothetical protein [Actimicrobium sp. CCI2.3]|uniref:hypothetical protein n=1 Tax=Actimicrobium sp. CCI2.3 TaxID=3048616 RepID=UPI002AB40893|nr:hypothetical protein [Actimicrobium sp. CCI2.3]MDY7574552.1 hypothetical protein [Actimicrobium sp. CCI2.3]MEB0020928.1 hypothetical protein [Actimicrobium sp. CCI2.3]